MLNAFRSLINIGALDQDSEALALKKSTLVLVPLIIGLAAFIWGLLYIFLDQYLSASIPLSYTLVSIFNLMHFHKTKNIIPLYKTQMILVLLLPFFLMWSLGGFALGSFVFIWAFFAPIAALTYEKNKNAMYWFFAFIVLVIISSFIDQELIRNHTNTMPPFAIELFYVLNIGAGLAGIFFLIRYFINMKERNANVRLEQEHQSLLAKSQELEEANAQLSYFANHDALTNLPNRYHLRNALNKMLIRAHQNKKILAIVFIDLDGFKEINNVYGHGKGDELLKVVSKRLKTLIGEDDTIARVGGDEFILALSNIEDLSSVIAMAKKVIKVVQEDYDFISSQYPVGASIGISLYPKHANEIDDLINYADTAMYEVKKVTKNSFLFYETRMAKIEEES